MEIETPAMPQKVKSYADAVELLGKLEGRAVLWERNARDAKERAEEFERAAQEIRDGATTVTVGRTTYRVDENGDEAHTQR